MCSPIQTQYNLNSENSPLDQSLRPVNLLPPEVLSRILSNIPHARSVLLTSKQFYHSSKDIQTHYLRLEKKLTTTKKMTSEELEKCQEDFKKETGEDLSLKRFFSMLPHLTEFDISDSNLNDDSLRDLIQIFGNSCLTGQLKILRFSGLSSVQNLPDLSLFTELDELCIKDCKVLQQALNLPSSLVNLLIADCSAFNQALDLTQNTRLENLVLSCLWAFDQPITFFDQGVFKKLSLKSLSEFNQTLNLPSSLVNLDISMCRAFNQVLDLSQNSLLENLELNWLNSFNQRVIFSNQSEFKNLFLRILDIFNQTLNLPCSLVNLNILNCANFNQALDLSQNTHLENLDLNKLRAFNQPIIFSDQGAFKTLVLKELDAFNQTLNLPSSAISIDAPNITFN